MKNDTLRVSRNFLLSEFSNPEIPLKKVKCIYFLGLLHLCFLGKSAFFPRSSQIHLTFIDS